MSAKGRLRHITKETSHLKDSNEAVGAEFLMNIGSWAPPTIHAMAARTASRARFINLVVSNVPGPADPDVHRGREAPRAVPDHADRGEHGPVDRRDVAGGDDGVRHHRGLGHPAGHRGPGRGHGRDDPRAAEGRRTGGVPPADPAEAQARRRAARRGGRPARGTDRSRAPGAAPAAAGPRPGGSPRRRSSSSCARACICWAQIAAWIPWKSPSSQPTSCAWASRISDSVGTPSIGGASASSSSDSSAGSASLISSRDRS